VAERFPALSADLVYEFQNVSEESVDLTIGLPFMMPSADEEGDVIGPNAEEDIVGLTTAIDGQDASVTRADLTVEQVDALNGTMYNRVYSVEVAFGPGETHVLRHRYMGFASFESSGGSKGLSYLLTTGRGWQGTIGSVAIDIEIPDMAPCTTVSLPYEKDGDWIRIRLSDWEPDGDLDVSFVLQDALLYDYYGDPEDAQASCAGVATLQPEDQLRWLAQTELAFGAPPTEYREPFAAEGPLNYCSRTDEWAWVSYELENGNESVAERASALRYSTDDRFPNTMPEALRECVTTTRTRLFEEPEQ
ncbi:MAG: hypothetical protein KC561_05245, partial [Myxococcales bacterium]|nr:hypothetical protein [Myxococcales bacterium]